MTTLWSFLLQTLTATGVTALVLAVKALFQDKLSPRWQFAAWLPLLLVLLLPAGRGGRYVLLNWPWYVETAKTLLTGSFDLTTVTAPIPLPALALPVRWDGWLFLLYCLGCLVLLVHYGLAYFRLRLALRKGTPAGETLQAQLKRVASQYDLPTCPAVAVPGLPSAFLCGLMRPVLALPDEVEVDDKVILHELLHLKHRDTLWSVLICALRCLHWCNPLLWYCADRAGNDLEALCDQRVLELLEGEERRDYGRILLSMANETYPRSPGTSSLANGGENIRRRIESIARFKRYPAGMGLVSACVILTLSAPVVMGAQATAIWQPSTYEESEFILAAGIASARLTPCTTYAGAFDTYAKAVMTANGLYRIACTPEEEVSDLARSLRVTSDTAVYSPIGRHSIAYFWDSGIQALLGEANDLERNDGYYIYNLEQVGGGYEGLLGMFCRMYNPVQGESSLPHIICQRLRAEKQNGRWVILPLEDFWMTPTTWSSLPHYGCKELPNWHYTGQTEEFSFTLLYDTSARVNSTVENLNTWPGFFSATSFDFTPKPNGTFEYNSGMMLSASYLGDEADKQLYRQLSVKSEPYPQYDRYAGTSSFSGQNSLNGEWEDPIWLCGVGGGGDPEHFVEPDSFTVHVTVFRSDTTLQEQITLLPVEGGPQ